MIAVVGPINLDFVVCPVRQPVSHRLFPPLKNRLASSSERWPGGGPEEMPTVPPTVGCLSGLRMAVTPGPNRS